MIEFKGVRKQFGSQVVLDQISFSIKPGEIVFILGKSGMGKSVLLKLIVGLLRADSGEIFVDNQNVTGISEEDYFAIRRVCGMVFQYPALLDSLTIYENLAFGLRAHQLCDSEDEVRRIVHEKLRLVHLRSDVLELFPSQLSFGMQKRASIARALTLDPKYLLFDEPTTGLDPVTTNAINGLIQELSRKLKVTSIVVSHDMPCAVEIADRVLFLDQGQFIEEGTIDQMLKSPVPLVKDFLKEVNHETSRHS